MTTEHAIGWILLTIWGVWAVYTILNEDWDE